MKSDNKNDIGQHCFERAGLGIAPFHFVGFSIQTYQACHGAPIQPGSSCDYCGQAIMNVCQVQDVNGKRFKVGPDCIRKVGDEGLIKAFKKSPEFRKHQREMRHKREKEKIDAGFALLEANKEKLQAMPHPKGMTDRKTGQALSYLDYFNFCLQYCGNSGKISWFKKLEKILKEN